MSNEIKARYSITTITTIDGVFAQEARDFVKANNVSHEAIYRAGLEHYKKELSEKV